MLSSSRGIRIDVPVLSVSWSVEEQSVIIQALRKNFSSARPVILEKSLAGSPLVQIVWQRLQHTQKGRRGMCSDTHNPGGEVRGCCVGCILDMPEISPSVFIAVGYQVHGIFRTKGMLFQTGVFWVRRNFLVFSLARNRYFVTDPFDAILNDMPYTASRRSLLSAVRSSSSGRRLAHSSTRRVL